MNLVFLVEERSMGEVLEVILPKILPEEVSVKVIPHSGKSDLQASISRKIISWKTPDTYFVIVHDQDSADCRMLKEHLKELVQKTGKSALIRIVCKELESWYFGDLQAVSKAYDKDLKGLAKKSKYRIPDQIENPKTELRKYVPLHQQIAGARKIAPYIDIENNTSESFRIFVKGVRDLCELCNPLHNVR